MRIYKYPTREELRELLKRPVRDAGQLNATVAAYWQTLRLRVMWQ